MSADNLIAVFPSFDSLGRPQRWYVAHGFMSQLEHPEDEEKWKEAIESDPMQKYYFTRISALVAAHDRAKKEALLEYGVVEL